MNFPTQVCGDMKADVAIERGGIHFYTQAVPLLLFEPNCQPHSLGHAASSGLMEFSLERQRLVCCLARCCSINSQEFLG